MNKDKLKALCHKLSKESGLPFNMIQTHYFLERILEQIPLTEEVLLDKFQSILLNSSSDIK